MTQRQKPIMHRTRFIENFSNIVVRTLILIILSSPNFRLLQLTALAIFLLSPTNGAVLLAEKLSKVDKMFPFDEENISSKPTVQSFKMRLSEVKWARKSETSSLLSFPLSAEASIIPNCYLDSMIRFSVKLNNGERFIFCGLSKERKGVNDFDENDPTWRSWDFHVTNRSKEKLQAVWPKIIELRPMNSCIADKRIKNRMIPLGIYYGLYEKPPK